MTTNKDVEIIGIALKEWAEFRIKMDTSIPFINYPYRSLEELNENYSRMRDALERIYENQGHHAFDIAKRALHAKA